MKKMLMVLMMVFTMMAGLFAYEPKAECVTVKGNKVYYEETYESSYRNTETRIWTYKIKSGKFIYYRSGTFDYMWATVESKREQYFNALALAEYEKAVKFSDGCTMNLKPYWTRVAKSHMTDIVNRCPFFTEENFLTLTKEEFTNKMEAFVEYCK